MEVQLGTKIFQNWEIKRLIGKGSFGAVYEIERSEFGRVYRAAAKIISISKDNFSTDGIFEEEMSVENETEYYRSLAEDVLEECDLMERMKGDSHIVSYEDHHVEQNEDGSWTIYIRMELMSSLKNYMKEQPLATRDVIQLGIDLCHGLESCQKYNVIHRDIKPENIFVSEMGNFKLGDFGISRVLSASEMAVSKKGTQLYMAPEVYRGEQYGSTVDLYSLGLVLFRFMNNNRTPFLPLYPEPIRFHDREMALHKRLTGEPVPLPCNAPGRLGEIIQKACSFKPENRYGSPGEMRRDLEAILYEEEEQKVIYPKGDDVLDKDVFAESTVNEQEASVPLLQNEEIEEERTISIYESNKNVLSENDIILVSKENVQQTHQTMENNSNQRLEDLQPSVLEPQKETNVAEQGIVKVTAMQKKPLKPWIICAIFVLVIGCVVGGVLVMKPFSDNTNVSQNSTATEQIELTTQATTEQEITTTEQLATLQGTEVATEASLADSPLSIIVDTCEVSAVDQTQISGTFHFSDELDNKEISYFFDELSYVGCRLDTEIESGDLSEGDYNEDSDDDIGVMLIPSDGRFRISINREYRDKLKVKSGKHICYIAYKRTNKTYLFSIGFEVKNGIITEAYVIE